MRGTELAAILRQLPTAQPLTDAYQDTGPLGAAPGSNWTTQKEHMVRWMSEIARPGVYGRTTRGRNARAGYNSLRCAPALLWIAEALGEDPVVVQRAISAAKTAPPNPGSQCAAVRRTIPWERLEDLARAHQTSRRPLRGLWRRPPQADTR